MDQKQDTVSNCCDAPVQPKPPMSLEQAQIELVMSEQELVLAERVYEATERVFEAASRAEAVSKLNRQTAVARRDYYREMLTKAARAMLIGLCLLLPRFAQAQTITIPVTVPPPATLTVPVPQGTKVVSNGITYIVTGTLTLTPVVVIGELPEPTVPFGYDPDWAPYGVVVAEKLEHPPIFPATDLPVEELDLGPVITDVTIDGIAGSHFGLLPGQVFLDCVDTPVLSWTDKKISLLPFTPNLVEVKRSDGAYHLVGLSLPG
jgi:hypothetical protein